MKQLRTPEDNEESKANNDNGKLRRWVSNLQLESWQLELLITGFSIFLLATSIDQYAEFSASFIFNKLVPSSVANGIFISSGQFIVNTIPFALKFFLISLLVHLLLRGFWIGIVGLSSVSSTIDLESLNLKGKFRKKIPEKTRSLDDLIFHLDQISSVIFAYTYLLAFSIISVVLVSTFLFSILGLGAYLQVVIGTGIASAAIITLITTLLVLIFFVGAVIFFLDTILFSAFKKSKWFSVLYYPIYRIFSVVSLSFIYRTIYYHLITNYSKKQIITVTLVLGATLFITERIDSWNTYPFYPEVVETNQYTVLRSHYDDERTKGFVYTASIPSRYIKNDYLELFIRYSPQYNEVLDLLCGDFRNVERNFSFSEAVNAGMQSSRDTIVNINDLLASDKEYDQLVKSSVECLTSIYEVYLDGTKLEGVDYFFTKHNNKGERGVGTVLDIANLERGRHLITINRLDYSGNPMLGQSIAEDKLKMIGLVTIFFWKE